MIRVDFDVAPVSDRLTEARTKLDDLTPVHQDIGEYMVKVTKDRFVSSTAPDGSRWRAKSPATIAAYLRRGDGNRPKPLIGPSGRLGREIASLISKDAVEIGSSLEYSGTMQFGAAKGAFGSTATGRPIPWGNIPARPWLGISGDDERNIIDIVDEYLDTALGA